MPPTLWFLVCWSTWHSSASTYVQQLVRRDVSPPQGSAQDRWKSPSSLRSFPSYSFADVVDQASASVAETSVEDAGARAVEVGSDGNIAVAEPTILHTHIDFAATPSFTAATSRVTSEKTFLQIQRDEGSDFRCRMLETETRDAHLPGLESILDLDVMCSEDEFLNSWNVVYLQGWSEHKASEKVAAAQVVTAAPLHRLTFPALSEDGHIHLDGHPTRGSEGSKGLNAPIDGVTEARCQHFTGFRTRPAWWAVDLGQEMDIAKVKIVNGGYKLHGDIYLGNDFGFYSNNKDVAQVRIPRRGMEEVQINAAGRYLFIVKRRRRLKLCAVEVFPMEPALSCPEGSVQVGERNADIPGCGMEACGARAHVRTISDCQEHCHRTRFCKAFSWTPGERGTSCTIYDSNQPTATSSSRQVFCKISLRQAPVIAPMPPTLPPPGEGTEPDEEDDDGGEKNATVGCRINDVPMEARNHSSVLAPNASNSMLSSDEVWKPKRSSTSEYLQLDLGKLDVVSGIVTKGYRSESDVNGEHGEWVKSFKVQYSVDGIKWIDFPREFTGNDASDCASGAQALFSSTIKTRFVKIMPTSWHKRIAMRVGLLQCRGSLVKVAFKCCRLVEAEGGSCHQHDTPLTNDATSVAALANHEPKCFGNKLLQGFRAHAPEKDSLSISYSCCSLGVGMDTYGCTHRQTTSTKAVHSVARLSEHKAVCPHKQAVASWVITNQSETGAGLAMEYECCKVESSGFLPDHRRTCFWQGGGHVITFDGSRHMVGGSLDGSTFWIVNSKVLKVQAYFESVMCSSCPPTCQGIVIGGSFLDGHTLVIKKDVTNLQIRESLLQQDGNATGLAGFIPHLHDVILWNGVEISGEMWNDGHLYVVPSTLVLAKTGSAVNVYMTRGVVLRVHMHHQYLSAALTMPSLSGQRGQCGNNNGEAKEKNLIGAYMVPRRRNMFGIKERTNRTHLYEAKPLHDCKLYDRAAARVLCKETIKAKSSKYEEFLDMCIYDACFGQEGKEFAAGHAEAAELQHMQSSYARPRAVQVSQVGATWRAEAAKKICSDKKMTMAKITSEAEQQGVMQAVATSNVKEDRLWLGASYVDGQWKWMDGSNVSGFTNWDYRASPEQPPADHMCMDAQTGKWDTCAHDQHYRVVCDDVTRYQIISFATPSQARSQCGQGHQLAMPKSEPELKRLVADISLGAGTGGEQVLLGGNFHNGIWQWDDGSPITFAKWKDGKAPSHSEGTWLCMDTASETWSACSDISTELVVCETATAAQGSTCAAGSYTPKQLGLSLLPQTTASDFEGSCFYLGRGGETCEETCYSQTKGHCSLRGLSLAESTPETCRMIVSGIMGNVPLGGATAAAGTTGCVFKDSGSKGGEPSTQVITGVDSQHPTAADCLATTSAPSEHRLCACDPVDGVYPTGHVLLLGERVRVSGKGWRDGQGFKITFKQIAQGEAEDTGDGILIFILEFRESEKVVLKKYAQAGQPSTSTESNLHQEQVDWWMFHAEASIADVAIDVDVTKEHWRVSVMGRRYPQLDVPRRSDMRVNRVSVDDVKKKNVGLIPQQVVSGSQPVAMLSTNGCQDYPVKFAADNVTFSFSLKAERLRGTVCVLCESGDEGEGGSHLLIQDGKFVVVLAGAKPHRQTFHHFRLEPGEEQHVMVAYLREEAVVELYVNSRRVQMLSYEKAPRLRLKEQAMLGCAGSSSSKAFEGELWDFTMQDHTPESRPRFATCDFLAQCPDGELRRQKAWSIQCKGSVCHLATDGATCCESLGKCRDYKCSGETRKNPNASASTCANAVCTDAECCFIPDSCRNHKCSAGTVHRPDPESHLTCTSSECSHEDNDICCELRSNCSSFQCPQDYSLRVEASTFLCAGATCNQTDFNTCCQVNDKCSSLLCDPGSVPKSTADKIFCQGVECSFADQENCCSPVAKCSTYSCPSERGLVTNPHEDRNCKAAVCDAGDEDACCVKEGTCEMFRCPDVYAQKKDAESISCSDATCSSEDFRHCCGERDRCDSLTCTGDYLPIEAPSTVFCKGVECTEDDDVGTCCQRRGLCSSIECPANQVVRENASSISCGGPVCSSADYSTCCVVQASCESLQCPEEQVQSEQAAVTHCRGEVCTYEDYGACCTDRANCSSAVCPEHPHHRPLIQGADHVLCAGLTCGSEDVSSCCVMPGTCSAMHCPDGLVHIAKASEVSCGTEKCTEADVQRCCDARATCDATMCREHYSLRRNASKTQCKLSFCAAAEHDMCCEELPRCSTLSCPAGFTHRDDAANLYCKSAGCEASDENLSACCVKSAQCSTFSCPGGLTLRAAADSIPCAGSSCSSQDVSACCEEVGNCSMYECPDGSTPKADAAKIQCKGALCRDTDFRVCCDDDSTCQLQSCPLGTVQRPNASEILCSLPQCKAESDVESCCEELAACESHTCGEGLAPRQNITARCKGTRCSSEDDEACCAPQGSCATFKCPAHSAHVLDASSTHCSAATECEESDVTTCCTERASCSELSCPSSYVAKEDLGGLLCMGKTCNLTNDRDACCSKRASCSSLHCPHQYVQKENASQLLCTGPRCSYEDVDHCCQERGRCSGKHCPSGYSLSPAAAGKLCRGAECSESEVMQECCIPDHTCANFTGCGDGGLRDDSASVQCSSSGCTREQCCISAKVAGHRHVGKTCADVECPEGTVQREEGQASTHSGAEVDIPLCCTPRASCQSYSHCPPHTHVTQNASILCSSHTCDHGDERTCCMNGAAAATCNTFDCPDGYVHRPGSSGISCDAEVCSMGMDFDKCCVQPDTCRGFSCPEPYVLRTDADDILCSGEKCALEADRHACCELKATCSNFTCTDGFAPRWDYEQRHCSGAVCNNDDLHNCCVEAGQCDSFACPTPWVRNASGSDLKCRGAVCEAGDRDVCCSTPVQCPAELCPQHHSLRQGGGELVCSSNPCTRADVQHCCEPHASCHRYNCPSGYVLRPDAEHVFCEGPTCSNSSFTQCCQEEDTCGTYTCPAGFSRVPEADTLHCSDSDCGDDDEELCCRLAGNCSSYSCPVGYSHRPHSHGLHCSAWKCDDSDLQTCCEELALCGSFACPVGTVHRPHSYKLPCAGENYDRCLETEERKCCATEGYCSSMQCPEGMVHRATADNTTCPGGSCSQAQHTDTCCELRATCQHFQCPTGYDLVDSPSTHMCAGSACSFHKDMATCCLPQSPCFQRWCPAGMVHKPTSLLSPHDDSTSECCAAAGSCEGYDCPEGFEHIDGPHQQSCRDRFCSEADKYICCKIVVRSHDMGNIAEERRVVTADAGKEQKETQSGHAIPQGFLPLWSLLIAACLHLWCSR